MMAVWLDVRSIGLKVAAWVSTKVALKVDGAAAKTVASWVVLISAMKVSLLGAKKAVW